MHPSRTLAFKLRAISEAGFSHVNFAFPDLEAYAIQEYIGYQKLDTVGRGDIEKVVQRCERRQSFVPSRRNENLGRPSVSPISVPPPIIVSE